MTDQPIHDFGREVRETIVKSGLTGVAATVMAVTIFSPAGLGGMVGTSLASGFGLDAGATPNDNIYANLPAYPAALSQEELSNIQGELARTTASLEITRAATEAKIDQIRTIAMADGLVDFVRTPVVADAPVRAASDELRPTTQEPPVIQASVPAPAPVSGGVNLAGYQGDRHLELAELMLAHENL